MANAEGKEFVWRVLSPLVAVAASPDVDELAKLNNLPSFADLLAPFGERMDGKVGIIDSQGHSTTLDHFTVRFTNANHLDRFDIGIVNKVVSDCMRRHDMAKKKLPTVKSKQDVEEVYGEVNMDSLTPWYTDYRNYLCKYTGASEHDTFNHPVSWLVVVSTANPDPVATAQSLSAENNLPAIFDRGYMDPNISKHYLLLHDEQTAPAVNAEALFEQMKKTFNMSACNLLNINSVPHPSTADSSDPFNQIPPPMPVVPDIWTPSQEDVGRLVDKLKQGLHSSSAASVASSVTSVASPTTEEGFPVFKDRSNVPVGAATGESKAETLGPLSSGVAGEAMLPPMQMDVPQLHLPSTVAYGNYLSEYDFTSLEGFVREFVTQKVIKNMERNIQHWNEQVGIML
ncbi:hypothetical protein HK104_006882 [Borealophlyctis nickersoniae]|nr:hypothetical protein HK104_006882 [Borealophlyctis nickersoniae]